MGLRDRQTAERTSLSSIPNPIARFLILLLVAAAAACQSSPAAKPVTKEAVLWRRVGSWSGHGNVQTDSFSVETGALKVSWETKKPPIAGGAFKVTLHSAISGRPLQVVVDSHGAGRDTLYIGDEPRVSYFVIQSDLDWELALEEAVSATS